MRSSPFIERLACAIARRPRWCLGAALVVTAAAAWATSHLPIHTSRNALFPKDEPVLKRLDAFLQRFGSASDLLVVLDGAPREVLEEFATTLAARLRGRPEVRDASERLDTDFFFARSYLMVPAATLGQLSGLLDRILAGPVPSLTGPVTLDTAIQAVDGWLQDPPPFSEGDVGLDVAREVLAVLDTMLEEWLRFVQAAEEPADLAWERLSPHPEARRFLSGRGYFATHDGRALVVFVSRKDPSSEFDVLAPFIRGVRGEADTLRAEFRARGKPAPEVGLTGLPATEYEEYVAVQADIVLVVSTAAVFILFLVFAWMRSLRRALVVFIPMGLGTVWNMGLTLFTVGHLTLLTAAFTAILFGLGVDYGIFLTSRILEELESEAASGGRRERSLRGVAPERLAAAVGRGTAASARGIVTAGGATVLIFLSLVVVPFRGFSELGVVAATGVALVLVATFLVTPALFAMMRPPLPRSPGGSATTAPGPRFRLTLSRRASLATAVVAALAAAVGLGFGIRIPFDYDVLNLLPAGSEAARLQKRLVAESDFQPEVLLVTAPDLAEARRLGSALRNLPVLSSVQSVVDLFPPDAEDKAAVARKAGDLVARTGVAEALARQSDVRLTSEDARRLATTLSRALDFVDEVQDQAFSAGHERIVEVLERVRSRIVALAEALRGDSEVPRVRTEAFFNHLLHAARRAAGVLAGWRDARPLVPEDLPASLRDRFFAPDGSVALYAYPRFSVYQPAMLDMTMGQVLAVAPEATGFPATHQVLSRMAVRSFWLGSALALVAALLVILLAVRSTQGFATASLPLVVGAGWMLGLMAALEMPFNYANIVGVPMVMALAVDYGVWFTHRRRELSNRTAWEAASVASQAILLAAGTTLAGLGAIMLGRYQGVASMGTCVTIGLLCCIVAARVISPAVAHVLEGRARRGGQEGGGSSEGGQP